MTNASRAAAAYGAWSQLASGAALDHAAPARGTFDIKRDIAEPLAKIARFNGHTPGGLYSVAQHCVHGADALFAETGDRAVALAFLLHDAPEAWLGDLTTPVRDAIIEQLDAADPTGFAGLRFQAVWSELNDRALAAISLACRAPWPWPDSVVAQVKLMDLRMLRTERAHLLVEGARPWSAAVEAARPVRLGARLSCWTWPDAADAWMDRLKRYGAPDPASRARPDATARRPRR